jgi:hypothetical protein
VTAQAHPDNLELALKATAALRLDVAGVDLLLPDIARSYQETGGVICEVNAKPQFSSGLAHRDILQQLLPHQGRIPVVGVKHSGVSRLELLNMVEAIQQEGLRVRLVSTPSECQQALQSVDVDALICQMEGNLWDTVHQPIDRFEVLILDNQVDKTSAVKWAADQQWVREPNIEIQAILNELIHYLRLICLGKQ